MKLQLCLVSFSLLCQTHYPFFTSPSNPQHSSLFLSDLFIITIVFVGVKGMLDKIGAEITGFSKMFPVEASLANFTIFLNERHKAIESYYPQIDQMDFYRFVCFSLKIY